MQTVQCGFICLMLVLFSNTARATIGTDCSVTGNNGCTGNNEVCDTGDTNRCICDNSYVDDGGTCKKDCQTPSNSTGYTVTAGSGATDTLEGAMATVACATGYSEDSGTPDPVACQASGSWAAPSGCVVDCGTPTNPTGYTLTASAGTQLGDTATVACAPGYTGTPSPASVTCPAGGSWPTSTGCSIVDCGTPTNPTGYTLTASAGTQLGDTATVACAPGYTGTPSPASVTCPAGGSWPTSTGCNIVDCSALTAPTNGTITYSSGTTYESVATFSCDTGYAVTGSAARTCGADGSWSGSNPTCEMNGAGGIRQKFSLVVLIGVLVLALM